MFSGGTAAEGFFQMVGDIGSDENAFPISHTFLKDSFWLVEELTLQLLNRSVSRILYPEKSGWRSFI